jgi:hypothetical protein
MPKLKNRATGKRKETAKAIVTKEEIEALNDKIEQGRTHRFLGQEEGELIVRWLEDSARPANDAVEQLIGLEVRFESGDMDAGRETTELINEAVRTWKLGLAPVASFSTLDGRSIVQRSTADTRKAPSAQSIAFSKAVELMQANLLTRVRRCKREGCGKWFFAVFPHASYHTEECRTQSVSTSPEFKERRKKYMRERRKRQIGGKK